MNLKESILGERSQCQKIRYCETPFIKKITYHHRGQISGCQRLALGGGGDYKQITQRNAGGKRTILYPY